MILQRILARTFFALFSDTTAAAIGLVAKNSGKRPSELFEWNNPDEWLERLLFDMDVNKVYMEAVTREK